MDIFTSYGMMLILPAAIGAAMRCALQTSEGGAPKITTVCVLVAAALWLAAWAVPSHGSELGGGIALVTSAFAAGMLLAEAILYVIRLARGPGAPRGM